MNKPVVALLLLAASLFVACTKPTTSLTTHITQLADFHRTETVANMAVEWTLPVIGGSEAAEAFSLDLQQRAETTLQQLIADNNAGEYTQTYTLYKDPNSGTLSFMVHHYVFLGGANGININRAYVLNQQTALPVQFTDLYTPQAIAFIEESINKEIQKNPLLNPGEVGYFVEAVAAFENALWFLDDGNLIVQFQQYDLGPRVLGMPSFTFPLSSLSAFQLF